MIILKWKLFQIRKSKRKGSRNVTLLDIMSGKLYLRYPTNDITDHSTVWRPDFKPIVYDNLRSLKTKVSPINKTIFYFRYC